MSATQVVIFEEAGQVAVANKREFRSKALQFAYDRYVGEDPELAAAFEEELSSADIASQIYNLRKRAGLSQRQLAAKLGTTASVICRLEDSDYEGHSLSMLRRIAAVLGRQVKIVLVPARRRRARA
jgi:ribosome-binding protein aMBF1 (putative translation factor)